jgi:hypothetical protein
MIRDIVVPKTNTLLITIPDAYIGKEIEYIVFDTKESTASKNPETLADKTQKMKAIEQIFEGKRISLKDFKFDRNEANNYD